MIALLGYWFFQRHLLRLKPQAPGPHQGAGSYSCENWSMSAFGDDVAAVVNKLKLKEVVLVGFSLGGPILHESLDVLIITPVAPVYRLASMVVPDEKIEIVCSHDCNIAMDAQVVKAVGYEEPISIRKYKNHAVFLRLKKRGLRQMSKLGF